MSNSSIIDDLIPLLPVEIQGEIRARLRRNRATRIISMCEGLLRTPYPLLRPRSFLYQWPNLDFPYRSPLAFVPLYSWTPVFYVYLWYLLNTYHMPIVFSPHLYITWDKWVYYDYTLFDKFWFEVFGEHWRVVASGHSSLHPLTEPINRHVLLIAKFNSNRPVMDNGRHEATQFEWVTNANGSLHGHDPEDLLNNVCQTAIWRAESLNTGDEYNTEEMATTPDAQMQMETN
ncbi:hypothetical protein LguiA_015605 [Lonicera macranthoides]